MAQAKPTRPVDPEQRLERIISVIRSLREGEVVTYGEIAHDAGFAKQSRLVGHILAITDDDLPWWRVVNSTGRLVPGHEQEQIALLQAEDVRCDRGRVTVARYGRFSRAPPRPPRLKR
ncbi:MAG: MGMT family protein [Ilumatobacteraceae bacterium]